MWYKNGHILSVCIVTVHYSMRAFALSNGWDLWWIPVGASSGETARQRKWHVLLLNLRVLWISSGNQSFSILVLTGSCTMSKNPKINYLFCLHGWMYILLHSHRQFHLCNSYLRPQAHIDILKHIIHIYFLFIIRALLVYFPWYFYISLLLQYFSSRWFKT